MFKNWLPASLIICFLVATIFLFENCAQSTQMVSKENASQTAETDY